MKGFVRFVLTACAVVPAACDDSTAPSDDVAVQFGVAAAANATNGSIILTGSNGVLTIDRIWLVVDELELKGSERNCPDDDDDACEFEVGPFFLKLPLNSSRITIARDDVPIGTFTRFEFEVKDLDFDDDDDDDEGRRDDDDDGDDDDEDDDDGDGRGRVNALFASIREEVPDWPRKASMLVTGTFTPTGGSPVPFRTFFDAEIEIEMRLDPPLVRTEESGGVVIVELDPTFWFRRFDGTVRNLALFDFATTRKLLEFELEIERGIDRVRVGFR